MFSRATTGARPRPLCLVAGQSDMISDSLGHLLAPEAEIIPILDGLAAATIAVRVFRPDIVIFTRSPSSNHRKTERQLTEACPGLIVIHLFEHVGMDTGDDVSGKYRSSTGAVTPPLTAPGTVGTITSRSADEKPIPPRHTAARPRGNLYRRQNQVLALLARGLRMRQISRLMNIPVRTVAFHKYRAMEENGLKNHEDVVNFVLLHSCAECSSEHSEPPLWR